MIGKGKKEMEKKEIFEIWQKAQETIKKKRHHIFQERNYDTQTWKYTKEEEIWMYTNEEGKLKENNEKEIKIILKREGTRKNYVKKVEERKKDLHERRDELKQHIEDKEIEKLEEEIEKILEEEREDVRVKKMWDLVKKLKGKGKPKAKKTVIWDEFTNERIEETARKVNAFDNKVRKMGKRKRKRSKRNSKKRR